MKASSTSSLAADLGINKEGSGGTLTGDAIPAGHVRLSGGTEVLLSELNGGSGVSTNDVKSLTLTGSTLLSALNNGDGVSAVSGVDFDVVLTDSTTVAVDLTLTSTSTIQTVIDAINTADTGDRLDVSINNSGTGLVLRDNMGGANDIVVQDQNGSTAAADLGILGTGVGVVLNGQAINDVSADLRITLTNGEQVDIDLSGLETVTDVLDTISSADTRLAAVINTAGTGIDISDAIDDGTNDIAVTALNGSSAAADLGFTTGTVTNNALAGADIAGSIRLDLRNDDDTLTGTNDDDFLTGGPGQDGLTGGAGHDTVVESRDADMTLADKSGSPSDDATLVIGSEGTDTLNGIESADLTGGDSNNTLDASAFTLGGVTLDGGAGNDTLTGTDDDDFLTGGSGQDLITGNLGTDTLVESGNHRFDLDNASLDTGEGSDEVQTITLSGVTSGNFTLTFDGETTRPIGYDATPQEVRQALRLLDNIGQDDVVVAAQSGGWRVTFTNNLAGQDVSDLTVGDNFTDGTVSISASDGASVDDTLSGIEKAELTGGKGRNLIDASGFSGDVVLDGVNGSNILLGGSGNDLLLGGPGSDTLRGGAGNDTIIGGGSFDFLEETRDANFTLTNTSLLIGGSETDTLSSIEVATLTGGASANVLDASGFTGLGADSLLADLNNLDGVGRAASITQADFSMTLRDGSTVDINLSLALTLQDVLDTITEADANLSAALNSAGTAIEITDASAGSDATFAIAARNNSTAAADLGLSAGSMSGGTFTAAAIPAGFVVLDGSGGADTLTGTIGNDTFTGGAGADTITGGGGIDTLIETRDADMTLADKSGSPANDATLVIGSEGTDTLVGITRAQLTGGASVNTIDASGFTLGSVVLATGKTLAANVATTGANADVADILKGTDQDDTFLVDVSDLTAGTHTVQVDPNLGDDEVVISGVGPTITQDDLGWIAWADADRATYTVSGDSLTISSSLSYTNGGAVKFNAHTLNIDADISTVTGATAGDITLSGRHINIKPGVQLLANAPNPANSGAITIEAVDDVARFLGFSLEKPSDFEYNGSFFGYANIDNVDVDITIDGTIRGGAVTILAAGDTVYYFEDSDFGNSDISSYLNQGTSGVLGLIENLSVFAGVAVTTVNAEVKIKSGAEIDAATVAVDANARANVYSAPISPGLGIAVGVGNTTAKVTVDGTIAATGNVVLGSKAFNRVDVVADATEVATGAASVAVSVVNSTSQIDVNDSATLTVGGDLILNAQTIDQNRTMARSTAGNDGAVGLAIAVSVENGDTSAYLDGTADVSGNITVAAQQEKQPVERNKVLIIPSKVTGVQAIAGVGTESKGDLLDDTQSKGIDLLFGKLITGVSNWWSKKWAETFGSSDAVWDFDIAAAFNVVVDNNTATARIGDGSSGADVQAGGDLNINALIQNRPDLTADASATDEGVATKNKDKPATSKGTAVAIAVGVYNNTASAYIAGDAQVDAKGILQITADALNVIDWKGLWGINLVTTFLNEDATYTTEDGKQPVHQGDTVDVRNGFTGTGNVGTRYESLADRNTIDLSSEDFSKEALWKAVGHAAYTTEDGSQPVNQGDTVDVRDGFTGTGDAGTRYASRVNRGTIDLSSEDFSDETLWDDVGNAAGDTAEEFIRTFTTYLDGNLGLDNNLIDSWGRASVNGQKKAKAGAINVVVTNHTAEALIKDGARINQRVADYTTTDVVIEANSTNHLASLQGNFLTFGITGGGTQSKGIKSWAPSVEKPGLGSSSAGGGSAGSAAVLVATAVNNVTAKIEDGVTLYAGSLEVDAATESVLVSVGASGGKASQTAFNGAFIFNVLVDDTQAVIDNGATIEVGSGSVSDPDAKGASVFVNATDTATLVAVAGSVAISESTGIGISAAGNIVVRDTEAYIGNRHDNSTVGTRGSLDVAGDVRVSAQDDGFIGALAVSGAKASPNSGNAGGDAATGIDEWSGSGDVITERLPTFDDSSGSLFDISKTKSEALDPAESNAAWSGAITFNVVNDDARAYVHDTGALTVNNLILDAQDDTIIASLAGVVAFATTGNNPANKAKGIAGALGVNIAWGTTESFLDGSTSITASSLDFDAGRTGWVVSLVAGVGGAKGRNGIGVGGSIAVNVTAYDTKTRLANTSGTVSGTVSLLADDELNMILVAGAGGFGGKAGVGFTLAFNNIGNEASSTIDTVTNFTHIGNLDVNAKGNGLIVSVAAAVGASTAGGEKGYGFGGTLAVNLIDYTVKAIIIDSTTLTGSTGNVTVKAEDESGIFAFSGGFASGKTAGLGFGLALNFFDNTILAKIDGSTIHSTGGVTVKAIENGWLAGVAVGGAGSEKAAVGGAVAVNKTTNAVNAFIDDSSDRASDDDYTASTSSVIVDGAVLVQAKDTTTSVVVSGGLAFSEKGSLGAGIGVNLIDNDITAKIDGATVQSTGSTVAVEALAKELIVSVAIGGAGATKFALGASIAVNEISNTVEAKVVNNADVDAYDDITIDAGDRSTMVVVAGAGAGSDKAAIGAAVSTTQVQNQIRADIDGSAVTSSDGAVAVTAGFDAPSAAADFSGTGLDTADLPSDVDLGAQVINVTVAGAGADTFAFGAAISLNWMRNTVEAYISNGADVDAAGDITVVATDNAHIISVAVGAAGADTTAVGAAIAYNFIGGDPGDPSRGVDANRDAIQEGIVRAYIDGSSTTVDSSAGAVNVLADATASIINVTIGAAGSKEVSIAGSFSINFMRNVIDAAIRGGATVNADTDINVAATVTPLMIIVAGAGSGAGQGVAGSVAFAVNDMRNALTARVEGSGTQVTASNDDINVVTQILNTSDTPSVALADDGDPSTTDDPSFDAQIWSFAVSGAGAENFAGAGAFSLNWLRNSLTATIADSATATANSGKITVKSEDLATLNALAGAIGISTNSAAIGASVAYNYIGGNPDKPSDETANVIEAVVDNATVTADSLELQARSNATINSASVSISGSGTFSGSGAIALNFIRKDVEAKVVGSADVDTTGDIDILAVDTSTIRSLAGQIGISTSGTGVGGSVAYNDIDNDIKAYIDGSTVDVTASNSGNIVIKAISDATIQTLAVGISGGDTTGVAGSGEGNLIKNQILAYINNASVSTDDHIYILADSSDDIQAAAGALGVGVEAAGVGGSVIVNIVETTTKAYISGDATVFALGTSGTIAVQQWADDDNGTASTENVQGLAVIASNAVTLDGVGVSLGLGEGFGLAANILINLVTNTTSAYISDSSVNSSTKRGKRVIVRAHQSTDNLLAGGAGSASLGSSFTVTINTDVINNSTSAYIVDSDSASDLDPIYASSIEVSALSRESLDTYAIGVAGGASFNISGAAGAIKSTSSTSAYVDRAKVDASGDMTIEADSRVFGRYIVGSGGGGIFGFGASVAVGLFGGTTEAYAVGADLDAGNDITINAESTEDASYLAVAGAVGGTAPAGVVLVQENTSTTRAYLGSYIPASGSPVDSTADAGQDVLVTASNETGINQGEQTYEEILGAIAVGGGGAGATVSVITLKNTVDAHIGADTIVNAERDVNVTAQIDHHIDEVLVAFGGGAVLGVAGAVGIVNVGTGMESTGENQATPAQDAIDNSLTGNLEGLSQDSNDTTATKLSNAGSSLFTVNLAADASNIQGVAAYIGQNAQVTAGSMGGSGDILVQAEESLHLQVDTGAGAIGAVSVGGSVTIFNLKGGQTAFVDNGAVLSATDDIEIRAKYHNNDVDANAYGGSGGIVGIGAQVALVYDEVSQRAFTDHGTSAANGVQIVKADDVIVKAEADRDIRVHAEGGTGGGIAAGAAAGEIEVGGRTEAYLGKYTQVGQDNTKTVDDLQVTALSTADLDWRVVASAGGIGAGVGNDANGKVDPDIRAFIDENSTIDVNNAVSVTATFTPKIHMDALGASGGVVSVGVSKADDLTIEPDIVAAIGDPDDSTLGNVDIGAASLSVLAQNLLPGTNHDGYTADVFARASGGGLIGINAVLSDIDDNTDVSSYIAQDATLVITGATSIQAENYTRHKAESNTHTGAGVAIGVSKATMTTTTSTTAFLAGESSLTSDSLIVSAYGSDDDHAEATAGAGGVSSGAGVELRTRNFSTVSAFIGDGSSTDKTTIDLDDGATGSFTLQAEHKAKFQHDGTIGNGGILSGSGANMDHRIDVDVTAEIGDYVEIDALSIDVDAISRAEKPDANHFDGRSGGFIDGTNADSQITIEFVTTVVVGDHSRLEVTGEVADPGEFSLNALNVFDVYDKITLNSGGLWGGAGAYIEIDIHDDGSDQDGGSDARVEIGDSDLISIGDIDISANGQGTVKATANVNTYGATTVQVSDITTDVRPVNDVTFAKGATLRSGGDINVSTGTSVDFVRDAYSIDAFLDAFAGSLIPITDLDATAYLIQTNTITVNSTALLESAGEIKLHAERFGFNDIRGQAKATSIYGDNDNSSANAEQYTGTVEQSATGNVKVDGILSTGANRNKSLLLDSWDADASTVGASENVGGIQYSVSTGAVSSGLVDEYLFAKAQLAEYGDTNPTLKSFYESELTRLETALRAQGFWNDDNSEPAPGPVSQQALTVTVKPILAQAGRIDIRADQLYGTGSIYAPSDASVTIRNETPAFLNIKGINIPETNGELYLNGLVVSDNTTIGNVNDGDKTVNFSTISTSLSYQDVQNSVTPSGGDPVVTVETVGYNPDGNTYPDPSIKISGDIDNLRGTVNLTNSEGNINILADVSANQLNVTAAGAVLVSGATFYNVDGDAYAQWSDLTLQTITESDGSKRKAIDIPSLSEVDSKLGQTPSGINVYGNIIAIDAAYINVNGRIQSGKNNNNLTLTGGASTIGSVAWQIAQIEALHKASVTRLTASNKDFDVYYDPVNDRIIVDDLRLSGGNIQLTGSIFNTANGEIKVLGGYGNINITNNTPYDVLIKGLDNTSRGIGTLLINDTARHLTTLYQKDANGVTKTTDDGSGPVVDTSNSSSNDFTYAPVANWRYGWSVDQLVVERTTTKYETDTWGLFGGDWVKFKDTADVVSQVSETLSGPALTDEGPYFFQQSITESSKTGDDKTDLLDAILGTAGGSASNNSNYKLGVDGADYFAYLDSTMYGHAVYTYDGSTSTVTNDEYEVSHSVDKKWYGTKIYKSTWVEETGTVTTSTHTIRADRNIAIVFIGGESGNITINSTVSGADILLQGDLRNTTGTTTITGKGAILQIGLDDEVQGQHIVLSAAGDIAHQSAGLALLTNLNDDSGASLKATTTSGDIRLQETLDDLRVDQIQTGSGDVELNAAGGILVASSKTGQVSGDSIGLFADGGAIGNGTTTPLQLDSGSGNSDNVTAHAVGNLFIKETSGDLRLFEARSDTGSVYINVASGDLIDANNNAVADVRTVEELTNGVWTDLQLTVNTGANAKIEAAKEAFATVKEGEYRTYWNYRNMQANPAVYDPTFVVNLSTAEDTFYRTELGFDQAAIDALVAKRTAEYHALHAEYGAFGDTFLESSLATATPLTVDIADNGNADTITRNDGGSFLTDGFTVGMSLRLQSADDGAPSANDNTDGDLYTITDVTASVITLSSDDSLSDETGVDVMLSQVFNYTLSSDEETLATQDIKVWTEEELTNLISAGLLAPVADTTATIEDVNVDAAVDVTLIASGSVGSAVTSRYAIDFTQPLSSADRLVLATAERSDVAFVVTGPVTATVNFAHLMAGGDTITRTDGGDWASDGFASGQTIEIWGNTENDTSGGRYYTIDTVTTDTITLISSDTLVNDNGVSVEVSQIVVDPLNTPFTINKLLVDQRDDIDINAGGDLKVTAGTTAYIGSEMDITVDQVSAGGAVRLKSGQGLFDAASSTVNVSSGELVLEASSTTIGTSINPFVADVANGETLTARAFGDVYLTENSGDMEVAVIFSQSGDVYLTTVSGDIVDGLDNVYENIIATNLTLNASGAIGESSDSLDMDLSPAGQLNATASGDVNLAEVVGSMNLGMVSSSSGDVELKAQGSILDDLNDGNANVLGNNIVLTATSGAIGASGNDLDIDSTYSAAGTLTSSSALNTYLIETAGDLSLYTVGTGSAQTAFILGPNRILNGNGGGSNVTSGRVRLFAGDDIGASDNPLVTTVGFMEGNSTSGSIYIVNFGPATVGGVTEPSGFEAPGQVNITAMSPVTVEKDITTTGIFDPSDGVTILDNGDIIITATDDNDDTPGNEDNIVIKAGVNIISQSGKVILRAGDNIIIEDGATIQGANGVELFVDYGNADDAPGHIQILGDVSGLTVRIEGENQNDVIDINDPITAPMIVIDGKQGNDEININTTINASGGTVEVYGSEGEDKINVTASSSITAGTMLIDGGSDDDKINVLGSVNLSNPDGLNIKGGSGDDKIIIAPMALTGYVKVEGGDGADQIEVDTLHSRMHEMDLIGGDGGDTYTIYTSGGDTDYLINVFDTGADGTSDELTIHGTDQADDFLLRASQNESAAGGVAFVAQLNPSDRVERINYDKDLELLILETEDGNDTVTLDDNWAVTTIDGGAGEDSFQVGQIYKSERDAAAGVADPQDVFSTIETTRGFLSNGISNPTTIEGGDNNDTFTIFRNLDKLLLKGNDGDDLFIVRSFAEEGSDDTNVDLTDNGGSDTVQYVANAPVDIDGGDGNDTLKVIGTEFADYFLVTDSYIKGAGRTITYTGLEFIEIDAAEGDDVFFIQSTNVNVKTSLFGGLGNDEFHLGGDAVNVDDGTLSISQEGPHTLLGIDGELILGGFSGSGSTSLPEPVLLPGESNVLDSVGTVQDFDGTGAGGVEDVMTVLTADLQTYVANDDDLNSLNDLIGFTLEISQGPGLRRFWQIAGVNNLDDGNTELTLLNPAQPAPEWGLPNNTSAFGINHLSVNFFVDEDTTQDAVRVFNDGSSTKDTGTLTDTQLQGLGLSPEHVTYSDMEQFEILLGTGDDTFTVSDTADGMITAVHGGGGDDTITVNGRGGVDSRGLDAPLVIFGDTTQDGSRYTDTDGEGDINPGYAYSFDNPGQDIIDASGSMAMVTIYGGAEDDILLKGSQAGDHIAGGSGNDNIDGQGGADHIYGDSGFNLDLASRLLSVVTSATGSSGNTSPVDDLTAGMDTIKGQDGDDIIFGDHGVITQTVATIRILTTGNVLKIETVEPDNGAMDTLYGGADDDILLGEAGGDDIDGGSGNDLIFGDHAILDRTNRVDDNTNLRYRVLNGTTIYMEGNEDGQVSVTSTPYTRPGASPSWADFDVTLYDYDETFANTSVFGNDYIAGGADDDTLFGQIGADVIQGDGSIDIVPAVGAYRDKTTGILVVNPSMEAPLTDGDDYIEGNSGQDVIFGNLGQDDLVGGSSDMFGLDTRDKRPDGSDIIFGAAGTSIDRNDAGDTSIDGHARDADVILGDNGNIYRLVGMNGTDGGAFLTFNYDTYSTMLRLVPRATELLDYTPGGADFNPAGQASDIGAADELHGEVGRRLALRYGRQ